MKKIVSIISIFIIFAAIGVGVYFGWQKSKEILTPPTNNLQPVTDNQQLPSLTTSKPKLKVISDQLVFDYWTAVSGDVFYISREGKIFKVAEKDDELISDRNFANLINIKTAKDGAMLIIKYGDLNSPKMEIFDAAKAIWQPLADNIVAADFSPDNSKLVYLEKAANGVSNLMTKDLNVSKPKTSKILSLTQLGFDIKWLSLEKILLMPAPSVDYISEIWQVDIKNKTIKPFLSNKGLIVKWSVESDLGLQLNSRNQLNLIDNNGNIKANIEISSLPDKCVLTDHKIYCAVMQNYLDILPKPVLPDDYLKKAFYSRDKIYAISMTDNSSEMILSDELPPAVDAVNLSIAGNNLLFINRYDNKVYSLEL